RAPALPDPSGSQLAPQLARVQEAGFVSRLVAFVLDVAIVSLASIVFGALIALILNFFGFSVRDLSLEAATRNWLVVLQLLIIPVSGLSVLLFAPGYFVLCWSLVGATPGKHILGRRGLRADGRRASWGRAFIRFAGYWISPLPLFLGFLWVLVDSRR